MEAIVKPRTRYSWINLFGGVFLMFVSFMFFAGIMQTYHEGMGFAFESFVITGLIFFVGFGTIFISIVKIGRSEFMFDVITVPKDLSQWRAVVKSRDSNKCVYCGEVDCLDAHHLAPKSMFPELRLNVNNGVTVCKTHHHFAADVFRRLQMVCTITSKG